MQAHVFVAMPFDAKEVKAGVIVDFDEVYSTLIAPALQKALTSSETIAISGIPQVSNAYAATPVTLLPVFHRDAIAFATRPLQRAPSGLGTITDTMVDEVSGLSLRLEVTREHKRIRFSYDILYGYAVVRRELGARFMRAA